MSDHNMLKLLEGFTRKPPRDHEMSYVDMVSFARAMFEIAWQYSDDTGEHILGFFESPHKWDTEYQKWRELGGTLEKDCLRQFEHWLDHRNDPEEDDDED